MLQFQGQLLSHSYITIRKVSMFFYGKFYLPPLRMGLEGDNETLRGRRNDVQTVAYEDSVNVERIYHNTSEYLSWEGNEEWRRIQLIAHRGYYNLLSLINFNFNEIFFSK